MPEAAVEDAELAGEAALAGALALVRVPAVELEGGDAEAGRAGQELAGLAGQGDEGLGPDGRHAGAVRLHATAREPFGEGGAEQRVGGVEAGQRRQHLVLGGREHARVQPWTGTSPRITSGAVGAMARPRRSPLAGIRESARLSQPLAAPPGWGVPFSSRSWPSKWERSR